MAQPLNEGKATAPEAEKLIEEIKALIEKKGLNVELVEKDDVVGQSATLDMCTRCTVCPCMICP